MRPVRNGTGSAFYRGSFVDSAGWVSAGNCTASHPLFREEAERIVRSLVFWEPAEKDGRKVASDGVLYIPFNPKFYRERLARQEPVLTACAGQRVDKEPEFPDDIRSLVMGNWHGLMRVSPDTATVTCRFTVNREGYVENARVVEGALRVVRSLPNRWSRTCMFNWGKHYLKFAPMKFTVSVHF